LGHSLGGLFASRPRRILVATVLIIAVLCTGAFAYWTSLPSPAGPKVTLTSSPFELSMMLDKTEYSLTNNISITFYLKNLSNETITASLPYAASVSPDDQTFKVVTVGEGVDTSFNQSYPTYTAGDDPLLGALPFSFTLINSSGVVVDKIPGAYAQMVWSIVFGPYASLNQTVTVNLAHYIDSEGHPLQKEAYTVIGAFEAYLNGGARFTWQTPSIAFTIG